MRGRSKRAAVAPRKGRQASKGAPSHPAEQQEPSRSPGYVPGITVRSLAVFLFALILMVVVHVFGETIEGSAWFYSMNILGFPALMAFLIVFGAVAGTRVFLKRQILTRAELVCVFFGLLTAAPIVGMGFWSNFIWLSSTLPSQSDFGRLDAVDDRLWPHGPNLLAGGFAAGSYEGRVEWRETEYEEGVRGAIPVLTNASPDESSGIRLHVPLEKSGKAFLTLGERYLLSVLARGADMGAGATLHCRIYYDDNPSYAIEAFTQPQPSEKITFLHKKGFQRFGVYGTEFATSVRDHIDVEFSLVGQGTLELADPKLMSVSAFEALFAGRQSVSESDYRAMRPSERAAYVVKPDSWWSRLGLHTLLLGYIPIGDWLQSVGMWLAFISLLLLATFAVALIMRRQWVKNERYPLPMARIPMTLLGVDDPERPEEAVPPIWKNRTAWVGFGIALAWCLLRAWYSFNPNVPKTEINIALKPYFDDPGWGQMWTGVGFSISLMVMCLAVFMELNVLLSLVIGFFLYRSLHWVGEAYGWNLASQGKYGMGAYPYGDEQLIGAYVTYGILTLFFTRRYLWQVIRKALGRRDAAPAARLDGHGSDDEQELVSYRTALALLALSFVGAVVWANFAGSRPRPCQRPGPAR